MSVVHYEPGVVYREDEDGWKVVAGCGAILSDAHGIGEDYTSPQLDMVNCDKCQEVYSLEFLAEVP